MSVGSGRVSSIHNANCSNPVSSGLWLARNLASRAATSRLDRLTHRLSVGKIVKPSATEPGCLFVRDKVFRRYERGR